MRKFLFSLQWRDRSCYPLCTLIKWKSICKIIQVGLIYRPSKHVCYSNGLNTASADAQNTHANNPLEFNEAVNGTKAKLVHKCLQDEGQHHLRTGCSAPSRKTIVLTPYLGCKIIIKFKISSKDVSRNNWFLSIGSHMCFFLGFDFEPPN